MSDEEQTPKASNPEDATEQVEGAAPETSEEAKPKKAPKPKAEKPAETAESAESAEAKPKKAAKAKKADADAEAGPAADAEEPKAKVAGTAKGGATTDAEAAPTPKADVAASAAAQVRQRRRGGGPAGDVKAIAKWVRMSPRKARRAIDLIRGKQVEEARLILNFLNLRAAKTVLKVLDSAVANAEHNKNLNRRDLVVKKAFVDGGPVLKRFQPHAQGRAFPIKKRTSHITVVVGK